MEKKLLISNQKLIKIILDTNFLFIPHQFSLDIFEELSRLLNKKYAPILLSSTKNELEGLTKSSSIKTQKEALFALNLSKKIHYVRIKKGSKETYDDVIIRVARNWNCPVATNDSELRKRLRSINVPVIFLRQKNRLDFEGSI
jgi:rRNA-processing protein FCF1